MKLDCYPLEQALLQEIAIIFALSLKLYSKENKTEKGAVHKTILCCILTLQNYYKAWCIITPLYCIIAQG